MVLPMQPAKKVHHLLAVLRTEVACRFVGKYDSGLCHYGAGDVNPMFVIHVEFAIDEVETLGYETDDTLAHVRAHVLTIPRVDAVVNVGQIENDMVLNKKNNKKILSFRLFLLLLHS